MTSSCPDDEVKYFNLSNLKLWATNFKIKKLHSSYALNQQFKCNPHSWVSSLYIWTFSRNLHPNQWDYGSVLSFSSSAEGLEGEQTWVAAAVAMVVAVTEEMLVAAAFWRLLPHFEGRRWEVSLSGVGGFAGDCHWSIKRSMMRERSYSEDYWWFHS